MSKDDTLRLSEYEKGRLINPPSRQHFFLDSMTSCFSDWKVKEMFLSSLLLFVNSATVFGRAGDEEKLYFYLHRPGKQLIRRPNGSMTCSFDKWPGGGGLFILLSSSLKS